MEGERARTLCEWAIYALEQGDTARSEAMWREARSIFEKIGAQVEAARMEDRPKFAAG